MTTRTDTPEKLRGDVCPSWCSGEHFVARYPAQDWAIVDTHRRYALVYDADARATHFASAAAVLTPHTDDEAAFQKMWQTYFHAVNIPERANPRLHLQHVPRRYWRYLTEKQPDLQGALPTT